MDKQNNLSKRLFDFSVRVIRLLRTLPNKAEYNVIKYQLIKSSSSSGANYEESQAGTSRADFNNKVRIALKEKRESNYWLRLIKATIEKKTFDYNELDYLIKESSELSKILGSIVNKTDKEKK
ncbi:MAG: four helix bundle protein [Bacteroidetes bacterium]|nr:MAG: four helix bundle protein [Bacteroidota bacterium]